VLAQELMSSLSIELPNLEKAGLQQVVLLYFERDNHCYFQ
jgi:hypothetical protein